jgi:collagen type VII alpha
LSGLIGSSPGRVGGGVTTGTLELGGQPDTRGLPGILGLSCLLVELGSAGLSGLDGVLGSLGLSGVFGSLGLLGLLGSFGVPGITVVIRLFGKGPGVTGVLRLLSFEGLLLAPGSDGTMIRDEDEGFS